MQGRTGGEVAINNLLRRLPFGHVALAAAALTAFVICCFWIPQIASLSNISEVLRQIAVPGLIAIGVTFVVICGRLDLSVGSLLSLCAVVAVHVQNAAGPVAAVAATVAVGVVAGCVNGALVAVLRLNSLIATLGTLSLLHGIALIYTAGQNWPVNHPETSGFAVFGRDYLGPVPVPVLILAGLSVLLWILLTRTTFGRRVFAVGGNETASRFSSINSTATIFTSYLLSGGMTAVAAIVFASRVMTARNDSGTGYEIAVLSGIILGGTSLIGGSGGIGRTIVGIIILGFVQNILVLLGLPYFTQWLVTWVVIIVAVWGDVARQRGRVFA